MSERSDMTSAETPARMEEHPLIHRAAGVLAELPFIDVHVNNFAQELASNSHRVITYLRLQADIMPDYSQDHVNYIINLVNQTLRDNGVEGVELHRRTYQISRGMGLVVPGDPNWGEDSLDQRLVASLETEVRDRLPILEAGETGWQQVGDFGVLIPKIKTGNYPKIFPMLVRRAEEEDVVTFLNEGEAGMMELFCKHGYVDLGYWLYYQKGHPNTFTNLKASLLEKVKELGIEDLFVDLDNGLCAVEGDVTRRGKYIASLTAEKGGYEKLLTEGEEIHARMLDYPDGRDIEFIVFTPKALMDFLGLKQLPVSLSGYTPYMMWIKGVEQVIDLSKNEHMLVVSYSDNAALPVVDLATTATERERMKKILERVTRRFEGSGIEVDKTTGKLVEGNLVFPLPIIHEPEEDG